MDRSGLFADGGVGPEPSDIDVAWRSLAVAVPINTGPGCSGPGIHPFFPLDVAVGEAEDAGAAMEGAGDVVERLAAIHDDAKEGAANAVGSGPLRKARVWVPSAQQSLE